MLTSRLIRARGLAPEDDPERADHAEEEGGHAMEADPLAHQQRAEEGGEARHDREERALVEAAGVAQRLEHAPEEEGQRPAEREIAEARAGRRQRQPFAPGHDGRHQQRGEDEAEAHHHRRIQAVGDVLAERKGRGDDDDDQEGERVGVRLARARGRVRLRCRLRGLPAHASPYRLRDGGKQPLVQDGRRIPGAAAGQNGWVSMGKLWSQLVRSTRFRRMRSRPSSCTTVWE